jgi:hypothetical protein
MYTTLYEETFKRIARDVIMQEGGQYAGTQYWEQRTEIGAEMEKSLTDALEKTDAMLIYFNL